MKKFFRFLALMFFVLVLGACGETTSSSSSPISSTTHTHKLENHDGKEPTCLEAGYKAYVTCSDCDYTTYEEIPALDHDLIHHEGKNATCTEAGHLEYDTCSRCDYTTYEEIPALDHDLIHHEGKDATCTEAGYAEYDTCSRCDYTTYKETSALDHDLVHHEGKDATCTEAGYSEYDTCSRCDYTTYDEIQMSDHDFGEIIVIIKPTCESVGSGKKICKDCEHEETFEISMIPHTYGAWTLVEESTCKEHGVEERICLVCDHKEQREAELAYHIFGDYVVTKEPTIYEEGIESRTCTVCGHEEDYPIDKLIGYTVTVSGGTVNKLGENINQNTIYVGEGEVVEIKANTYEDYTFYQWFSDGSEIIPTSTFKLFVNRNTYFYICFEEALDYGEWVLEQERSCTQDGIYSRTEAVTGLKQYMILPKVYHQMTYEPVVETEPTCSSYGLSYYECEICGEKEYFETSKLKHEFDEERIVQEAHGSIVGIKEKECTICGHVERQEYIDAIYPEGDLEIEFIWDHRSYVSSADRTERHWKIDDEKYMFYIMRESSGHSSGTYMHFYFYFEDKGENSPVYVQKVYGSKYNPLYYGYGSYGWGIITYVDSYDEFIDYIADESKGNDNGRNNSSLYSVYRMWERIFNAAGGIPSSYYCSGITTYLGYECKIYTNDNFFYYVNEDNCCLYYAGLGTNRDQAWVDSIEPLEEFTFDSVNFDSIKYIRIDIENGNDINFNDNSYFQIENLNYAVEIAESSYISSREQVVGFEIKKHDGSWVTIENLTKNGSYWKIDGDDNTYLDLVEKYLDGIYPECVEIRAITEQAELPVNVKVENGTIYADNKYYEIEENFLANEEVTFYPDYNYGSEKVKSWEITVNGVTTVYDEEGIYSVDLTLPASGEVVAKCIIEEMDKLSVTVNTVGSGSVNIETGEYHIGTVLEAIATPSAGNIFVGWFVNGLYNYSHGDETESNSGINQDYLEYGEFFGSKEFMNFEIYDPYDDIVITAVFEQIDTTKDYIDIKVVDGFINGYSQNALLVSDLRILNPDYYLIFGFDDEILGWNVSEQTDEGVLETELEGSYTDYYFAYDTEVEAIKTVEKE